MTEIKNETGTKKKLLIPVVVLMLLGVGLVGAAYAYNSTVTVNGNGITGESFVLEMNNKDGALISAPISIKGIEFTTDTTISTTNGVDVVAHTLEGNEYKGTLIIRDSDATAGSKALTVTATSTLNDGTIAANEVDGASEGPITYAVAVSLYYDSACENAYGSTVTFANDHTATLYYKITVTASGSLHFANNTPTADVNAVTTQLAKEKFTLTFEATAPTA